MTIASLILKSLSLPSFALELVTSFVKIFYYISHLKKGPKLTDHERFLLDMLKNDRLKERIDYTKESYELIHDYNRPPTERFRELDKKIRIVALPYSDSPVFKRAMQLWENMIQSFQS